MTRSEQRTRSILTRELLEEEFVKNEKTMQQIAQEHNVAVGSVCNYCKRFGISREKYTEKYRKAVSARTKGKPSPAKGKKLAPEQCAKQKGKNKGKWHKPSQYGGHTKLREDGYVAVYLPDHPNASIEGYVMEHHLVMEAKIGRFIKKGEVVHHINHDRKDNRLENLQLMTFKEHASLHMRERNEKIAKERRNDLSITAQ